MSFIICTLFEGHYHYGLAGLVNSLHHNGFEGNLYAGYKGNLPFWATGLTAVNFNERDAFSKKIATNFQLIFVPLTTNYHLTNYKPDFMLDVWSYDKNEAEGIFYFDPDITLIKTWKHVKNWALCGVAVSEDINSPLQEWHPRRCAWRAYFKKHDINLQFKNPIYVNGGFAGTSKYDIGFLQVWKNVQEAMAVEINGLNRSAFLNSDQLSENFSGDFAPFGKTDQDALNAAIEAYNGNISYGGKEVMGFTSGLAIILHALGAPKPWKKNFTTAFLAGRMPSKAERQFWQYCSYPIKVFSKPQVSYKRFLILFYTFLGRFYKRN